MKRNTYMEESFYASTVVQMRYSQELEWSNNVVWKDKEKIDVEKSELWMCV